MSTIPIRYSTIALILLASVRLHGQDKMDATKGDPAGSVETIVFIRHGEKPADDKGQLDCQGLNRALALPPILVGKFGKPDYLFAPDPAKKITKSGVTYSYVRPLMTIEPTAILLDMPIETKFGYEDAVPLQEELSAPAYQRAVIFVAWEHSVLDTIVKNLVSAFGAKPDDVPEWPSADFDSIFVVKIHTDAGKRVATFEHDHEGLDGSLSNDFPRVTAGGIP